MKGSAGDLVAITFHAPGSTRISLTRLQADVEEMGVTAADGSRITRNDIVRSLIDHAESLSKPEKKAILLAGFDATKGTEQA